MSSFQEPVGNYRHIKKTIVSPGRILLNHTLINKLSFGFQKRMSFFSSLRDRTCVASMAVEASIALPIFLFFIMNILFSFDMLRLHGNIMGAMHQTGNKMAFYGYAYHSLSEDGAILSEGMDSVVLSEGYARTKVTELLGKEYLNNTCLVSGAAGLHFLKSSVMEEEDVIDLRASYRVRPFLQLVGFPDFSMENRYYGRAWTGYDVASRVSDETAEDPIVYVTENGSVYHVARNCSYLNPSIEAVSVQMISQLRNASGEKYYSCGSCSRDEYQAVVYVTSEGSRIHGSLKCSALRRTIYTVHLSEVVGKGKCSKCGR